MFVRFHDDLVELLFRLKKEKAVVNVEGGVEGEGHIMHLPLHQYVQSTLFVFYAEIRMLREECMDRHAVQDNDTSL